MEEDPGRIVYSEGGMNVRNTALIDYNRAGVALIEIVTEPDFTGPKEVRQFLNKLSLTLEHLGVCDTLLEGSVRCDVNVSMNGGNKVEIKNINSFEMEVINRVILFLSTQDVTCFCFLLRPKENVSSFLKFPLCHYNRHMLFQYQSM